MNNLNHRTVFDDWQREAEKRFEMAVKSFSEGEYEEATTLAALTNAAAQIEQFILLREQTNHLRDIADTLESMRHGE